MNTLHIYAQDGWHSDAYIVGTEDALIALRNAISVALEGQDSHTTTFCADGEGYGIGVFLCGEKEMDEIPLPYTSDSAKDDDRGRWTVLLKKAAYAQQEREGKAG